MPDQKKILKTKNLQKTPKTKKLVKKILIAEDEIPLMKLISNHIKSLGIMSIEATDGEQAISKFSKLKPDLVLLDLVMPKKNGFEVLEEIKINQNSSVPVVIISNLDQEQDRETAKNLGAIDYIVKSNISLRELSRIAKSYLRRS